jgi:hypothetical protein
MATNEVTTLIEQAERAMGEDGSYDAEHDALTLAVALLKERERIALDAFVSGIIGKAYLEMVEVVFPPYERRQTVDVAVTIMVTDPNAEPVNELLPSHEFEGKGRTLGHACTECLTNFRVRFGGGS